jgi:hypothetical protein
MMGEYIAVIFRQMPPTDLLHEPSVRWNPFFHNVLAANDFPNELR